MDCIYHQQLCPCKILQPETQDRPAPTLDVQWNLRWKYWKWHLMYCTYHTTIYNSLPAWVNYLDWFCLCNLSCFRSTLGWFQMYSPMPIAKQLSAIFAVRFAMSFGPFLGLVWALFGPSRHFQKIKKSMRSPGLHLHRELPEIRFVKHWCA